MEILVKATQLILSLSILVVLHELGHFIPAKLFKTRVEKFYLFFNPWFSLFKKKIGETEYGIGWLPLGGYVKIAGMIDESMDKEQMKQPAHEWEFRAKPTWQRLIIMVGGVTVNLLLGMAIYSMILFTWGKEYLPLENVKYGVVCDSLLLNYGFQDGDKILKAGNQRPEDLMELNKLILIKGERDITINRNGEEKIISLPENISEQLLENRIKSLFEPRVLFIVDTILGGTPAAESEIAQGDKIIGINDLQTPFFNDFKREIVKHKGEKISVLVERNEEIKKIEVGVTDEGTIGVGNMNPFKYFETKKHEYGFFESIPAGISYGTNVLVGYAQSMKLLFSAAGVKQIGGFGTFGGLFSPVWDWESFWNLTAFISIILAFMNILPIPALDGGHVVFLLYEMVTRRKPNEKVLEYAQIAGMVLLFTLLIYANGNDIVRFFGK